MEAPATKRLHVAEAHWKSRYIVLTSKALIVYDEKPTELEESVDERISLLKVTQVLVSNEPAYTLQVCSHPNQSLFLQLGTEGERDQWVQAIQMEAAKYRQFKDGIEVT